MSDQPPFEAPQHRQQDDLNQMAHFGITAEQKTVYHYQSYVYDRLADALVYARIDAAKMDKAREASADEDVNDTSGQAPSR